MNKQYILYLRWRHQDPWTAYLIECIPDNKFDSVKGSKWYNLDIEYFKDIELDACKLNALKMAGKFLSLINN